MKKEYILILIILVLAIILVQQTLTTSLECKGDEVPLTRCIGNKEVVYKCVPDPDNCSLRISDDCEKDGMCKLIHGSGSCACPNCENMWIRCIPNEAYLILFPTYSD